MKIRSTFSPTVSPRMYLQTEGQISAALQTHRSVFSQSLQAVLLQNFFTLLPRVEIYLYCMCSGVVQSCQLTNSCYITARNALHSRRSQSSGTLVLETLCTNYTCIMVTDVTSVYCMRHIAY